MYNYRCALLLYKKTPSKKGLKKKNFFVSYCFGISFFLTLTVWSLSMSIVPVETAVIAKKATASNPKKTFLVFIVKEFLVNK